MNKKDEALKKQIYMTLVNVASYKDVDLHEYTAAIMQILYQRERELLERVEEKLGVVRTPSGMFKQHYSLSPGDLYQLKAEIEKESKEA